MNFLDSVVAALGRPFTLGMLYDVRKDELIPGLMLWDENTLTKNTVVSEQNSSESEISASDTIGSKSSLLDVDASLKASFLCGLMSVEGSANYLNDNKKFKNQSRVTLQYKATTNFKQLSMTHLDTMDIQQKEVIEKGSATHVVTGILYGANAFFVFDSEKLEASNVQNIQGTMEALTNKIPSFSFKGKVNMKLTDEENALTNKFSCKFYGDLILESNPATFQEAVKTYVELPHLLGEKGQNSVPLKVWLMPLKNLDFSNAEPKKQISVGLVTKVQDTFEDLKQIGMRCNELLVDQVVQNFPHIQERLNRFQTLCINYASNLQETMKKKLPSIREGKEDEMSGINLFSADRVKSPFSQDKLTEWLDHKEREINVIRSCVEIMEGIKILQSQSELDSEVLSPGVDQALCFVFTSIQNADPCLDAMAKYLHTPQLYQPNEEPWYYSDDVVIKMREKAETLYKFANAQKNNSRLHFRIATIANKKYTGATIYRYIKAACDLTLDPDMVNNHLTLSEGNKKVTYGEKQTHPDCPERFDVECQLLINLDILVFVSYIGIKRKEECNIAFDNKSWCFFLHFDHFKVIELFAWLNKIKWDIPVTSEVFKNVGVFLDWHAGTLSFSRVSSDTLCHLHTFHTTFTEPVYPGFAICPHEEKWNFHPAPCVWSLKR
uniref:SPRY-associated domain-containing protein n=1 Tax=Mola mola TaxID=94237 RepID=A0A3Q3WFE9_MOLML